MNTTATLQTRILETLARASQPLDDDDLARRLDVQPRQTVNQACRALAAAGRLSRYVGPHGKIVNDIRRDDGPEEVESAPIVEPAPEPKAGDSAEQRRAESIMLAELSRTLGVTLSPRRFSFPDGVRAEVDGADPEARVLVEVWAHQGPPKAAQKHKVLADAMRLLFVASTLPVAPKLILCLSDPAAAHHFVDGRSWAAAALRAFGLEVVVVDLPDLLRAEVLAAQRRQFR